MPALTHYEPTIFYLHQAARLLETVRLLTRPPMPLYLQLPLEPQETALSTGVLPDGSQVLLDFGQAALLHGQTVLPLAEHTQATLLEALYQALESAGTITLPATSGNYSDRLYLALANSGHPAYPKPPTLNHDTPLQIDKTTTAEYGHILYTLFTTIARFRARLTGLCSPLVVWPHHFDLSMLWFAGTALDDYQPHLNFGFAPFSEGLPRPYLYAYAYPYPANLTTPPMPKGTYWHTTGWRGAVLPYDTIAQQPQPEQFVEQTCQALFHTLRSLLP